MHRGYIKIWRKIKDSGLYQLPETFTLIMFILTESTHQPRRIGNTLLQRGQYSSGRKELAQQLKQSEQTVRTGLDRLKKLEILTIETTSHGSIYTVVNYNLYQVNESEYNQQLNQPLTSDQPAANQPLTSDQPAANQPLTSDQPHNKHINTKHINTETQKLESKNLSTPSASTAKKGTRLPDDWVLLKAWGDWALSENPTWTADDVRRVADDFRDHWISKAGKDAVKLNWLATWRKWVRSPLNEVKPPSRSGGYNAVQEARLDIARQIFGDKQNGNDRQTIDITPGRTIAGDCSNVQEAVPFLRGSGIG